MSKQKTQIKINQKSTYTELQNLIIETVDITTHTGFKCHKLNRNSLISLYKGLSLTREKKLMCDVESGKANRVSFSKLEYIFGDKIPYLLMNKLKIKDFIDNIRLKNTRYFVKSRRGNVYSLLCYQNYISNILKNTVKYKLPSFGILKEDSISEIAHKVRNSLEFNIQDFRSLKDNDRISDTKSGYIRDKFNKKNFFVFYTHDSIKGIIPPLNKIGDNSNFEGFSLSLSEDNNKIAFCISSKIDDSKRKFTTIIALLYETLINGTNTLIGSGGIFDLCEDSYNFVGNFFMDEKEIILYKNKQYNNWKELEKDSMSVGVSASFFNWFLFYKDKKSEYERLVKMRPEKKQQGNQTLYLISRKEKFFHVVPKEIISQIEDTKKVQSLFPGMTVKDGRKMVKEFNL